MGLGWVVYNFEGCVMKIRAKYLGLSQDSKVEECDVIKIVLKYACAKRYYNAAFDSWVRYVDYKIAAKECLRLT